MEQGEACLAERSSGCSIRVLYFLKQSPLQGACTFRRLRPAHAQSSRKYPCALVLVLSMPLSMLPWLYEAICLPLSLCTAQSALLLQAPFCSRSFVHRVCHRKLDCRPCTIARVVSKEGVNLHYKMHRDSEYVHGWTKPEPST